MRRTLVVTAVGAIAAVMVGSVPGQAADKAVFCGGRRATIVGTDAGQLIRGTSGPDVIAALGGNDQIDGRGGDDFLCGGEGGDKLYGGPGNDRLFGGAPMVRLGDDSPGPSDLMDGGPGNDVFVPGFRKVPSMVTVISFEFAPGPISADLGAGVVTGWGTDQILGADGTHTTRVVGSRFGDSVLGSPLRDRVVGGPGDDTLQGQDGSDLLTDGPGNDSVQGGPGDDVLDIRAGFDTVYGHSGNDLIFDDYNDRRPDQLYAGPGRDSLSVDIADSADWAISGGDGFDSIDLTWTVVDGGLVVPVDVTTDMVAGTFSFDGRGIVFPFDGLESVGVVRGRGTWTAWGTEGDDVYSTPSATALEAHLLGGDDLVEGSDRSDSLDGGPGDDTAHGHGGSDTCTSIEHRTSCEIVA